MKVSRETFWSSDNLAIPINEFLKMFRLTEKELAREGMTGRLIVRGRPIVSPTHGRGWGGLEVTEGAARTWIQSPDLPPRIQRKVRDAGGFDCLDAWRRQYFERIRWENNEIILPNGERLTDVHIRSKRPFN